MKQTLLLLAFITFSANAQEKFTVYFDFDISEANNESGQKLSQWIVQNPLARIQKIYGYTDQTGSDTYNRDLSEKREKFVYQQLKSANINVQYAEEKAFGESQSTASYNAADRKVEIYYANPAIQPVPTAPVESDLSKQVSTAQKGDRIKLKNVNFYPNSDVALETSLPAMSDLLKVMKERPSLKIEVQGHVCCMQETTDKVSLKRALAVYNYLVNNGIDKKRLSYTSFGNNRPIYPVPEENEEQRIANRRVEIEIVQN